MWNQRNEHGQTFPITGDENLYYGKAFSVRHGANLCPAQTSDKLRFCPIQIAWLGFCGASIMVFNFAVREDFAMLGP